MPQRGLYEGGLQEYYDIVPCSLEHVTQPDALNDTGRASTGSALFKGGSPVSSLDLLEAYASPIAEIGTDDDQTVSVDQPGFSAALNARWDDEDPVGAPHTGEHLIGVKGRMERGAAVPADITGATVEAVHVVGAPAGTEFRFRAYRLEADVNGKLSTVTTPLFVSGAADDTLQRWHHLLNDPEGSATVFEAAKNGWLYISVNTGSLVGYEVAFLGIRVSWWVEEARVTPPIRLHPRDPDALGTASARRHWPPPRSQQHGHRRGAGGYF